MMCQNSTLPKDECPDGYADDRGCGHSADYQGATFLDPRPTCARSVDCGGPAKPCPVEILQDGPTGPRTLENADHQSAIAILPPKSHSQPYRIYRLENIDAIVRLWRQQRKSLVF
jgi:hypothetical protein